MTGRFADWWSGWLLNLEGEDHARLRRLLNPAFSPKTLAALSPQFTALAGELIDDFAATGHCEYVSQFAEPYAARVIAILLGLPQDEWSRIAEYSTTIGLALGVTFAQELPRIEEALDSLFAYGDEIIADRRAHPKDDFATRLVQAQRDDDAMTDQELKDALALLIFGGFDTTRNQLGLAMQPFLQHPDQWKLLAANPELGGPAVEEVMRVNPTVTWVTREALVDFDFQGLSIKAGTTIHLFSRVRRHRSACHGQPGVRHHRDRSPPALRVRRRRAPLPRTLRRPVRHVRGAPAPCAAAHRPPHRRRALVDAPLGQHRTELAAHQLHPWSLTPPPQRITDRRVPLSRSVVRTPSRRERAMKVTVDMSLCQDHGQCAIAAPAVFQMDENSKLVYDGEFDEALLSEVEEAADVCPVQAIFIGA